MIKNFKTKKDAGFSTLEMLIAMTILVMVLSAIIFVTFGNQSLLIDSQTNSEALNKAQELLEQAQANARKDFKMVNSSTTSTVDDIYTKSISVSSVDYFTKKVTATISWLGDHKKSEHIDLTSLITNFDNAVGGDTCYSVLTGDWTKPKILNSSTNNLASFVSNDTSGTYQITDLDVFQNKLYVTTSNSGGSPSVGPKSPTASINKTGIGTVSWSNPSGALVNGGSLATASLGSNATSNYLWVSGFGTALNIPKGATILGIQVDVWRSASSTSSIVDNQARLIKSDGVTLSTTDNKKASTWSTGITDNVYGSASDLWGESWTASDINSSNFGFAFSVKNSVSSSRTANVDYISITVTYAKQFYVFSTTTNLTNTSTDRVGEISDSSSAPSLGVGFNSIAVDGNFAYIATNAGPSTGQLEIINIKTAPYAVLSTFKVPSVTGSGTQAFGNTIFYKAGYVYLGLTKTGTGPEFNIIDVHNPSLPTLAGSATIGNDVNAIYVLGNYAYVASPNANDLLVYNVGVDKLATGMTSVASFNGFGGLHGKSIYVVGDTAYLGRTFGTNELYVLDTSTLSSIVEKGHLDLTALPANQNSINSMIVRDSLSFFITTAGQFQIWRTDNPASMTRYDGATPLAQFPSANNFNPLDCEGNNIYGAYTDSSNKGYLDVITSS